MKRQGVGKREKGIGVVLLLCALWAGGEAWAQNISFGDSGAQTGKKQHVMLLSNSVVVTPGKVQVVELRFRVEDGFHINSHTPKDGLLIPTTLKAVAGVDVKGVEYPAGKPFKLTVGDGEVLDVYQGDFLVKVRLIADPGQSTMTATLHYQACDNAACFPPRDLAVRVDVTGK